MKPPIQITEDYTYTTKEVNNVCCKYCGIMSFAHFHKKGTFPKDFERTDEKISDLAVPNMNWTGRDVYNEKGEVIEKRIKSETFLCPACQESINTEFFFQRNGGHICNKGGFEVVVYPQKSIQPKTEETTFEKADRLSDVQASDVSPSPEKEEWELCKCDRCFQIKKIGQILEQRTDVKNGKALCVECTKETYDVRQRTLEEVEKKMKSLNEKVPCDCPKGGLVGEKYPCDKCGGLEWYRKHICRFNDGDERCECYEIALSDLLAEIKRLKEIK